MPDNPQKTVNLSAPVETNGEIENAPSNGVDEEELARQELARTMPSKAKLRELAKKNPPMPEWFDEEEEAPF